MINALQLLEFAGSRATSTSQQKFDALSAGIQDLQAKIQKYQDEILEGETETRELSRNRLLNIQKLAKLATTLKVKRHELESLQTNIEANQAECLQIQAQIEALQMELEAFKPPFLQQNQDIQTAVNLFDLNRIVAIARSLDNSEVLSYRIIIDSIIDQLKDIPAITDLLILLDKEDATEEEFIIMGDILESFGSERFQNLLVLILQDKERLVAFVDNQLNQEELRELIIQQILIIRDIERFVDLVYPDKSQNEPEFAIEQVPAFFRVGGTDSKAVSTKAYAIPEESEDGIILKKAYLDPSSQRYTYTLTIAGLRYLYVEFENIDIERPNLKVRSIAPRSPGVFTSQKHLDIRLMLIPSLAVGALEESKHSIQSLQYVPHSTVQREASIERENMPVVLQRSNLILIFKHVPQRFGLSANVSLEETVKKIQSYIPDFKEGQTEDYFTILPSTYFTFKGFLKLFTYFTSKDYAKETGQPYNLEALVKQLLDKGFLQYLPERLPYSEESLLKFFTMIVEAYELKIYATQPVLRGINEIFNAYLDEDGEISFYNPKRIGAARAILTADANNKAENRIIIERAQNYLANIKSTTVVRFLAEIAKENPGINAANGIRLLANQYKEILKGEADTQLPEFAELQTTLVRFARLLETENYADMTLAGFINEILENRFRRYELWKPFDIVQNLQEAGLKTDPGIRIVSALENCGLDNSYFKVAIDGTILYKTKFITKFVSVIERLKVRLIDRVIDTQTLIQILALIQKTPEPVIQVEVPVEPVPTEKPSLLEEPKLGAIVGEVEKDRDRDLMDDIFDEPNTDNLLTLHLALSASSCTIIDVIDSIIPGRFIHVDNGQIIRTIRSQVLQLNSSAQISGTEPFFGALVAIRSKLINPQTLTVKEILPIISLVKDIAIDISADESKLADTKKIDIKRELEYILMIERFIKKIQNFQIKTKVEDLTLYQLAQDEWQDEVENLLKEAIDFQESEIDVVLREEDETQVEVESAEEYEMQQIEALLESIGELSQSVALGELYKANYRNIQSSVNINNGNKAAFIKGFTNDINAIALIQEIAERLNNPDINNLASKIYELGTNMNNYYYICLAFALYHSTSLETLIEELSKYSKKEGTEDKQVFWIDNFSEFEGGVRAYCKIHGWNFDQIFNSIKGKLPLIDQALADGSRPEFMRLDDSGAYKYNQGKKSIPVDFIGYTVASRDLYRCMFVKVTIYIEGKGSVTSRHFVEIGHPRDFGETKSDKRADLIQKFVLDNMQQMVEDAQNQVEG